MDIDVDRLVAAVAEQHHGIFAVHHLRDLAVTRRERGWRLTEGRWIELYHGVYRIAGAPVSWRGALLAACWAGGTRAVASHRSAAALHDLPGRATAVAEITCPRWRRTQHGGLVVHESCALSERDIAVVDGIPVTTVERTIFDLAAVCGWLTVDLAIDNALRRNLATFDSLVAVLRRVGKQGRKGTKVFRDMLELRDAQYEPTESERELMLLRLLRAHGLPEPECQFSIHDDEGNFVARPDLVYRDLKIAIEYDSDQHHVGRAARVRDNRRRNAMESIGWAVLVATAEDVRYGTGTQFVRDVMRARRKREAASMQHV
jgi:predicted transcriptional regulator of viral defense system/very-short-patch-repair endonuclease